MFSTRNILNDGVHNISGLGGVLLCETRWTEHESLQVVVRTNVVVVNKTAFACALRLHCPDERRPQSSPTDSSVAREETPLLVVGEHDDAWLPVKFLGDFYLSVRPQPENEHGRHSARPPTAEERAKGHGGAECSTSPRHHYSQTLELSSRANSTSRWCTLVCYPRCNPRCHANGSADEQLSCASTTAVMIAVSAGWHSTGQRHSTSAVPVAGRRSRGRTYRVLLAPPLQIENVLPTPIEVSIRAPALVAMPTTPRAIREASPVAAGPLLRVVVNNDTAACLCAVKVADDDNATTARRASRRFAAYSSSAWVCEFRPVADKACLRCDECWLLELQGTDMAVRTAWDLRLSLSSASQVEGAKFPWSLTDRIVSTKVVRRRHRRQLDSDCAGGNGRGVGDAGGGGCGGGSGGGQRRTTVGDVGVGRRHVGQPGVRCQLRTHMEFGVVTLEIGLHPQGGATRRVPHGPKPPAAASRQLTSVLPPGGRLALHCCHPSRHASFSFKLLGGNNSVGSEHPLAVRWFADDGPRVASEHVVHQVVNLQRLDLPSLDDNWHARHHSSVTVESNIGRSPHTVRCSQEQLAASHTHRVYVWCSVWILNTTVLPMNFEDAASGRLALTLDAQSDGDSASNAAEAAPIATPSVLHLAQQRFSSPRHTARAQHGTAPSGATTPLHEYRQQPKPHRMPAPQGNRHTDFDGASLSLLEVVQEHSEETTWVSSLLGGVRACDPFARQRDRQDGDSEIPLAADKAVDAIKIALRAKTQWTQALKIDTPGTTHDFFLDDVFGIGDRLQLSMSVDMLPCFRQRRTLPARQHQGRSGGGSSVDPGDDGVFRAHTRVVTVMPFAAIFNLLPPLLPTRKVLVFTSQACPRTGNRTRRSGELRQPSSASTTVHDRLEACPHVVEFESWIPLVWSDRRAPKAICVVRWRSGGFVCARQLAVQLARRCVAPPAPRRTHVSLRNCIVGFGRRTGKHATSHGTQVAVVSRRPQLQLVTPHCRGQPR